MTSKAPSPASNYHGGSKAACPQCGGPVNRIPRRLSDRLQSIFKNTHRYRCRGFSCQWEGPIAVEPQGNNTHSIGTARH